MGIIIILLVIVGGVGCGMVVHRLMTGGFLINHGQLERWVDNLAHSIF
ncbi:MAG: hypothetical protein Q4G54_09075 [Pelistega sp.]|nr:hypothetical protein [Pelistega sp.]